MNGLAAPAAMAAAVAAYVGIYHLWLHLQRPRSSDLYFSVMCACMAAYDCAAAYLYGAQSFADGRFFQRIQFVAVSAMGMPLVLLVSEQGGLQLPRWGRRLALLFPLGSLAIALDPGDWSLTLTPLMKNLRTPWGIYQVFEVEVGPLVKLLELSVPLLVVYCLWVGLGAYRYEKGVGLRPQVQRSSPLVLVAAALLVGVLHDILVSRRIFNHPYILEYGWFAVMATMSWALSNEVRDAAQTKETLNETELRVATTLASIQDAVVTTDQNGLVTHMNPAAEKMLAVRLQSAEKTPLEQHIEITSPQTRKVVEDPIRFALGRAPNPYGRLPQLVTRDGNERHVDLGGSPLSDPQGRVLGAIIVLRDLTLQHNALDTLQHAKKMESLGQLAGGTAHDLNNLLTPIISYVELVQRQVDDNSKVALYLGHVQDAAQRAAELTRQLLAFSRKQVLDVQVVPLDAFLEKTRPLMERLVGENVAVSLSLEHGTARVRIDPGQFEQVLLNLASNARDAVDGKGTLVIKTRPAGDGSVCLSVRDDGCGMSSDTLERIFEPFFTTKPRGKGTGLGLASVRGIVEQHGGSIFVDSEPSEGTSFEIFLPTTDKEQAISSDSARSRGDLFVGTERILVVDDDPAVRQLVLDALTSLGYQVRCADGLAQAVEVAKTQSLELLLTDVVLPMADGPRIFEEVSKYCAVPCLYMTGHADDRLGERGIVSRGTEVLRKPFTVAELGQKVRKILDRHQQISPPDLQVSPPSSEASS